MFAFDLMKATWEEKIPKSQAIELNVDIVMSSSPIHFCSETLLNLIQLEKVKVSSDRSKCTRWIGLRLKLLPGAGRNQGWVTGKFPPEIFKILFSS